MASVAAKSSRENTRREDDACFRLCTLCNDYKPQVAFPKRQWPKKDRRCKYCITKSVPFYRTKETEKSSETFDIDTPLKSISIDEDWKREESSTQGPLTPPSIATIATERSDEFSSEESIDIRSCRVETRGNEQMSHEEDTSKQQQETGVTEADIVDPDNSMADENIAEPAVSLDEDIENLARNWTPPVTEKTSPSRAPPPSSAPPEPPESDDNGSRRSRSWRSILFLFASPILDETGSGKSVLAGLFTLFLVGSIIGVFSKKNPSFHSEWYQYVSAMIGYIYFLCWSVSFYPQVISNYKRRTTAGLSADFCALNVLGFACYTAYNASLFWSPAIRELYREKYGSEVTVQSNDVAFAIHALLLSSITLVQISYYRGSERPSKLILAVIVLILMLCATYPILVSMKYFTWLDYLYVLSFVKIGISLIKYMPQVVLNHQRKSTAGWSIWNILLDFTGGVLSDLQLILDCSDMGDFSGITGNLAKFGLGFVSIIFDVIFMAQHYVLYPEVRRARDPNRPETEPLLSEGSPQNANGDETV